MVRTALIALVLAASACAAREAPLSDKSPGHSPPMPAPRDGQVAVQEEFDAAARANTTAAWDLFIRRHPDNPLTEPARAARTAIKGRS